MAAVAAVAVGAAIALVVAVEPEGATSASNTTTSTASARPVPTTVATPTPTAEPDPCAHAPDLDAATGGPPPDGLVTALGSALGDPRFQGRTVGISIWVEGWGEVLAHDADVPLLPASNQKVATAMAALAVLDHDFAFETSVLPDGLVEDGTLVGDLVLVGGGDPTLTRSGSHSLTTLAHRTRDAGITTVTGALLVDEERYSTERAAPGWLDWQRPTYVGALSALIVDENRWRSDAAFLEDPALAAGDAFLAALADSGVAIAGTVRYGTAPNDRPPATALHSPSVGDLVMTMLRSSDNTIAESLFREVGRQGGDLSYAGGTAASTDLFTAWCTGPDGVVGVDGDGSGLSRDSLRSADEWRRLLQLARDEPWFPVLYDGLPVAGRSGTLASRLTGAATAGNVRAKTGSTVPARALSGYLTTAGGREAVFSIVVNGKDDGQPVPNATSPVGAEYAIDQLVTTLAAWPG